jgi:serine O-acetyltransferase
MFSRLRADIACILIRDPAARTAWEVLTCELPGLARGRPAPPCALVLDACFKWLGRFLTHRAWIDRY